MKRYTYSSINYKRIALGAVVIAVALLNSSCQSSADLKREYEAKVRAYHDQIEQAPHNEQLRLKAAQFFYAFKDYPQVILLLTGQTNRKARILLAKALTRQKEYDKAIEIFEQTGETNDSEYLYLYAQTAETKNLYIKAVALYQKVKGEWQQAAAKRLSEIGIKIEDQVPSEIKNLLKQEKEFIASITEDEAVTLLSDEVIEVFDNNTSIATIHTIKKVLKEKGKDEAEVQVDYDSTYERVELEYARTITTDGKVIYAGKESIRDVSKYLNYPLYSNAKVFIISMPAVDVGAIIEYKVKLYSSKLIANDNFNYIYRLHEQHPIAQAKFQLCIPKHRNIYFDYIHQKYAGEISLAPLMTETENQRLYSWAFKHIKPIIPEERMPPVPAVNPAAAISSFKSWDTIYQWWQSLYQDKLALTAAMQEFLAQHLSKAKTPKEKARLIYEFCAQNIRYVGVEYGESGYEPHSAQDVFTNRYGDCKDKAILTVALMRAAGLKAYPVLIPTRQVYPISPQFPSMKFNHAIAAVEVDGQVIFIDPTSSTTSFGDLPRDDQDRYVLVFFDDRYEVIKTPVLKDNRIEYKTKITIDANEDAVIDRRVVTTGFYADYQRYYLQYTHPQRIQETIQQKIKEISPFAKLQLLDIKDTQQLDRLPILHYRFTAKKFLQTANDLRLLPLLKDINIDVGFTAKDTRNFPLEFDGLLTKKAVVQIDLPQNLEVKYLPQDRELVTNWFTFKTTYTHKNSQIQCEQVWQITKKQVDPDKYQEFKQDLEKVFYCLQETIVLEHNHEQ